jgi:hypothetical protein
VRSFIRPCKSCDTDIYLVRNLTTDKWMPVDVDTHQVGNIKVDVYRGTCEVLTGPPLAAARADETIDLHLAHHVTCPNSDRHRGPEHGQHLFDPEELE